MLKRMIPNPYPNNTKTATPEYFSKAVAVFGLCSQCLCNEKALLIHGCIVYMELGFDTDKERCIPYRDQTVSVIANAFGLSQYEGQASLS